MIVIHYRLLLFTGLAVFFGILLAQYLLPRTADVRAETNVFTTIDPLAADPTYTHVLLPSQVRGALTTPAVLDPVVARLGAAAIGRALDPFQFGRASPGAAADAIRRRLVVVAGSRAGTVDLRLRSTSPGLGTAILAGLANGTRVPPQEGMALVVLGPLGRAEITAPDRSAAHAILVAVLVAGLAAAGALLLREFLEKGFTSPGGVEALTGLPVLATIPETPEERAPSDLVITAPQTLFARALRTLAREADLGGTTALALCSALPGEGKTTISIALARTLAEAGRRVVLVDCDGRRRALSRSFPGEPALGLVDLMAGRATVEEVLETDPLSDALLIRHGREGVIQDFSNRTAVRNLVRDLRQRFDVVLLDTGPVLALAEARVIGSVVDEVLLIARWRSTPVAATRLALKLLYAANARLAGAAFTRVRRGMPDRDDRSSGRPLRSGGTTVVGDALHSAQARR